MTAMLPRELSIWLIPAQVVLFPPLPRHGSSCLQHAANHVGVRSQCQGVAESKTVGQRFAQSSPGNPWDTTDGLRRAHQRRHVVLVTGKILEFGRSPIPIIGPAIEDLGVVVDERHVQFAGKLPHDLC